MKREDGLVPYLSIVQLKSGQMKSSGHRLWPVNWKDVAVIAGQRPPHPEKGSREEVEKWMRDSSSNLIRDDGDDSDSLETG